LNPTDQEKIDTLKASLDSADADYTILAHEESVTTAEDGAQKGFGRLEAMAPSLILRSENGYIAAIISGVSRLSYKKIKKELGLKNISFASAEQISTLTGAQPGCVSLVNPGLRTIVDDRLLAQEYVFGGCGVPKHTLQIRVEDLITVTQARVFDFTELKQPGHREHDRRPG
jgi:prolyl-tRNA editing enzyme YbaK/EbsC (Cys-tRNA(Pro) deacylase)